MRPQKRFYCAATPEGSAWSLHAPQPVGPADTFLARLRAMAAGAPVALGIDCPIGLPRAYAAGLPEADFPSFLRGLAARPAFFRVAATLEEVRVDAPFYPARGVAGMTRAAHAAALGLAGPGALCRACDRATPERPAGAPVFWTLGANQSGKAAIAAWRDMLGPASRAGGVRLWPFEGNFLQLLAPGAVAVAETYPAEAMRHLSLRIAGSKRRQGDRAAYAEPILAAARRLGAAPSAACEAEVRDGFGASEDGEDRFDSVLGVLCVLGVLRGVRPDGTPPDEWIRRWEGWVLGQTALPRA